MRINDKILEKRAVFIIKKRLIPIIILAAVCAIFLLRREHTYTKTVCAAFDTVCTVTTYSKSDNTLVYADFLEALSSRLSAYDEGGEIYTLNKTGSAELSPDTTGLLCTAISYSGFFPELFDISVNPLCELWTEFKERGKVGDISQAMQRVGCDGIYVDADKNFAEITKDGASVTLGAIAKGYASDALVDLMRKNGETSALINLGGSIYALGKKENKSDWRVGICDPDFTENSLLTLSVSDTAVVTSGDYERYFEIDGKRYHHIIDPTTGYPAQSGLRSATAVGKKAELCDVMSTAMFVAGAKKAAALCEKYAIDAVLVTDDTVYYTPGLAGILEPKSDRFVFKPTTEIPD